MDGLLPAPAGTVLGRVNAERRAEFAAALTDALAAGATGGDDGDGGDNAR